MKIDAYEHISDEELGAKIRRSHQKHLEKVQANSEVWEKEQKEISENIGACVAVISHFEHGKYVRSRNLVKHAYDMAMKKIQNDRNSILEGEN